MNNRHTALERIRSADTVPSMDAFPSGALTSDALLARIDERSTMTDTLTPLELEKPPGPQQRNRGPLLAMAAAAAVLLVVGVFGFVMLAGDDTVAPASGDFTRRQPGGGGPATAESGSLPADTPPLDVALAHMERWERGDVPGSEAVIAPDAYFIGANIDIMRADVAPLYARASWHVLVTGATVDTTCIQLTDERVQCDTVITSGLTPGTVLLDEPAILVISEGQIVGFEYPEGAGNLVGADALGIQGYQAWLRSTDPDAHAELFVFGETMVLETETVRKSHQEKIAEYLAATSEG